MSTTTVLEDLMRELAALEDSKVREANQRRGDDHDPRSSAAPDEEEPSSTA